MSEEAEAAAAAGREALSRVDAVLAAKPKKDDDTLSDAAEAICLFRERVIAAGEPPTPGGRLEVVNAVLAVLLGVHYPIGEAPWDELEKARGWLAGTVPAA